MPDQAKTEAAEHKEADMRLKVTQRVGFLLLAIWLILQGLVSLTALSFAGLGAIMGLLAIAAGVLILLER
jgi:hypothetical protein